MDEDDIAAEKTFGQESSTQADRTGRKTNCFPRNICDFKFGSWPGGNGTIIVC